jgi:PIN domain nuclease of toxin-antitoxin system
MLALRAGSYDVRHRDPFERKLAAESELESRVLVTRDTSFEESAFVATW